MKLTLNNRRKWLIGAGAALLLTATRALLSSASGILSSIVRPAKAGMSSRGRTCRGKSQKPRS